MADNAKSPPGTVVKKLAIKTKILLVTTREPNRKRTQQCFYNIEGKYHMYYYYVSLCHLLPHTHSTAEDESTSLRRVGDISSG